MHSSGMIQWRRIELCSQLCCRRSRQASRVPGPCRQLEHKTRTRDTVAAVKQGHKYDSKAGPSSTSNPFNKPSNLHVHEPNRGMVTATQSPEISTPDPRPPNQACFSLPSFVFVFVFPDNQAYHQLQTLRRYLIPNNLNLIKCLGQPNFIYLALPTTFATRKNPSSGQATLCQYRDLSTSVMQRIICFFSPQRAIFLQYMTHAAIIGYRQDRS